jgi:glutamyl-tRNA reductase
LRVKLNHVRERELAAALKRLPDLTPAQRTVVGRLSQALMNDFMHAPSVRLRAAPADDRAPLVDAACYLFALDDDVVVVDENAVSRGVRAA